MNSTVAAPDASAQLDVSSTDKGMLVPRMATAKINLPQGLILHRTIRGRW
ncbi:MAG: hypothetical protein IPM82_21635 [Saprospiraceae bacterium]|nr:hypothetical protein [Saprospiraceae bacterium]